MPTDPVETYRNSESNLHRTASQPKPQLYTKEVSYKVCKMMSRATHVGFPNVPDQVQGIQMLSTEELVSPSDQANPSSVSHSSSLLFSLSLLKDKVSQVQTLVGVLVSPDQNLPESTSMAIASSINSIIQEIIVSATSMAFTAQQIALCSSSCTTMSNCTVEDQQNQQQQSGGDRKLPQSNFANNSNSIEASDWFSQNYNNNFNLREDDDRVSLAISEKANNIRVQLSLDQDKTDESYEKATLSADNCDIIELDAAELLAKYTHYCQICGKGFKRDANLRMHMRAHGDEYKTSAALSNPNKGMMFGSESKVCLMNSRPKKYSCPHEGCRWNRKHAKFQPLKSMICVKNHYKRSHCPKMYVCKRCNQKQFSVLSDLRTHEKHCGDVKWQCSCGTTFSRKDKLMGHVALFVGHTPAINYLSCPEKLQQTAL